MKSISPERVARSKRVKSLIEMAGLSRRNFGQKAGISASTLQHWESMTSHGLPENSAKKFLKALENFNIECTYEWLVHGTGSHPNKRNFINDYFANQITPYLTQHQQVNQIQDELALFLKHNKEATQFVVNDNAMEPHYLQGDIVGGVRRYGADIQTLINRDCVVLIKGGDIYLRSIRKGNIPGHYHLTHLNSFTTSPNPFFYDVKLVHAAPVIWLRRHDDFECAKEKA